MSEENTRDRLIVSYLSLGLEKGFCNVSVQDVALRTGIQKPSVFYHFRSFDVLKEDAAAYAASCLGGDFPIDTRSAGLTDFLYAFFDSLAALFSGLGARAALAISRECGSHDLAARHLMEKIDSMIESRLSVALELALERGWTENSSTDILARFMTPFIRDVFSADPSDDDLLDIADDLARLVAG